MLRQAVFGQYRALLRLVRACTVIQKLETQAEVIDRVLLAAVVHSSGLMRRMRDPGLRWVISLRITGSWFVDHLMSFNAEGIVQYVCVNFILLLLLLPSFYLGNQTRKILQGTTPRTVAIAAGLIMAATNACHGV